jgi:hypothetical protein
MTNPTDSSVPWLNDEWISQMITMTVRLAPVGNTTPSELRNLRHQTEVAVRQLRDVNDVSSIYTDAPNGAKGIAEDIGAFLVGIPPTLIASVLETVKAILSRPGQPLTHVVVRLDSVELSFDPKRVSVDEMAKLVNQIRPHNGTA